MTATADTINGEPAPPQAGPFLSWPRANEQWEGVVRALTPYAEELWDRLQLMEGRRGGTSAQVYAVTGLLYGDGASTTAAALAQVAMRGFHRRVLLVEADLREPKLRELGLAPRCLGFGSVLQRQARLRGSIFELPRAGFWVLPAGNAVENASGVIAPAQLAAFLRAVDSAFDVVLLDTPPLTSAPEARHLIAAADATVPVLRSGRTLPETAAYWLGKIGEYGGRVGAVCLNGVESVLPARLRAMF